jgi:hypothetical protein
MENHLLNTPGLHDMRAFYDHAKIYATSTNGDIALIRSHIAYHCGEKFAQLAAIKPSRGHSYRVNMYGNFGRDDKIVKISDHYDHRDGVHGIVSEMVPA